MHHEYMNRQNLPDGSQAGTNQPGSGNILHEAAKQAGALTKAVVTEGAKTLIKGPVKGGKYPTLQDHGVFCAVCRKKRWCRIA